MPRKKPGGSKRSDVTGFGILGLLYKDSRAPGERGLGLGAGGETGKARGARAKERRVLRRPGAGCGGGSGPSRTGQGWAPLGGGPSTGVGGRGPGSRCRKAGGRAEGMGRHLAAKGRAAEGEGRGAEGEGEGRHLGANTGRWRARVGVSVWAPEGWRGGGGKVEGQWAKVGFWEPGRE